MKDHEKFTLDTFSQVFLKDNKYDIIDIGDDMVSKYVRVMDGLKSNAGGFEYKIDEVNIADKWNPNNLEAEGTGGFNFGTEDKILRWLHRGDTIYDVIIPSDAEVIKVDDEKGIYRANKIIVTNPRKVTDEMVIELYKKNTLSNKIIAQCLLTLIWKNRLEISKYIIKDRVDLNNVDEILEEFVAYAGDKNQGISMPFCFQLFK